MAIASPDRSLSGDNPTVRLDLDNEPQPDGVLLMTEEVGGQTRISEDDYIEGAPELIVEIAASSAAIDLTDKKRAIAAMECGSTLCGRFLSGDWIGLSWSQVNT